MPPGLRIYGQTWEFNGPLFEPLWRLIDAGGLAPRVKAGLDWLKGATGWQESLDALYPFVYPQLLAKALLAAGLLVFLARLWWRPPAPAIAIGRALAGLLVASSTVYPWYLVGLLPWAALCRRRAWLLASLLMPLAYLPRFWPALHLFPWIHLLIWLPVFGLLLARRKLVHRLTITYDGAEFGGWQRQINARNVQEEVERALSDLLGETIAVIGASRTDSGVHARGQACHFHLPRPFQAQGLVFGGNHRLPADVRMLAAHAMPEGFHAQRSALGKLYSYRFVVGRVASPLDRLQAAALPFPLGLAAVREALRHLARPPRLLRPSPWPAAATPIPAAGSSPPGSTRRRAGLVFRFWGDGFLRGMVRALVGTLVEVGRGRRTPENVAELLRGGRTAAPRASPPRPAGSASSGFSTAALAAAGRLLGARGGRGRASVVALPPARRAPRADPAAGTPPAAGVHSLKLRVLTGLVISAISLAVVLVFSPELSSLVFALVCLGALVEFVAIVRQVLPSAPLRSLLPLESRRSRLFFYFLQRADALLSAMELLCLLIALLFGVVVCVLFGGTAMKDAVGALGILTFAIPHFVLAADRLFLADAQRPLAGGPADSGGGDGRLARLFRRPRLGPAQAGAGDQPQQELGRRGRRPGRQRADGRWCGAGCGSATWTSAIC